MDQMEQCKFIIAGIEHLEDGGIRLAYTVRREPRHLTLEHDVFLGWRLRLYVSEERGTLDLECVGFRFEGDERMYKYSVRYRDSNARAGSKWPEADGVILRDDLETDRAIEAVFVPWDWKTRGG